MDSKSMLGFYVRDTITGYRGVVTGVVSYLTGCDQALVQPDTKADGEFIESRWFDVLRLAVEAQHASAAAILSAPVADAGPDKPAPRK